MNRPLSVRRVRDDFDRRLLTAFDGGADSTLSAYINKCQSPIEELFFGGVVAFQEVRGIIGCPMGGPHHCVFDCGDVVSEVVSKGLDRRDKRFGWLQVSGADFLYGGVDYLWIQYPVGKYRADFVWARVMLNSYASRAAAIAIECDGKQFHDATTDQVDRDRVRDREFQVSGLPTMRFTGSEINRDFSACVDQVDAALDVAIESQGWRQAKEKWWVGGGETP